eukprot:9472494-Pyramimonas_sp.AAC.1
MSMEKQIVGYPPTVLPRDQELLHLRTDDAMFGTPQHSHGMKEAAKVVSLDHNDVRAPALRSAHNASINAPVSISDSDSPSGRPDTPRPAEETRLYHSLDELGDSGSEASAEGSPLCAAPPLTSGSGSRCAGRLETSPTRSGILRARSPRARPSGSARRRRPRASSGAPSHSACAARSSSSSCRVADDCFNKGPKCAEVPEFRCPGSLGKCKKAVCTACS